ncbi:CinA family nicotinamide mononucleotide deamidase-related protein [Vibrio sp. AK197]
MLKIAMLSTGEEVLHGDIVDTNASWLSELFFESGFELVKRSTVGDQMTALVEELLMLSFNSDVVIVNGGLGPTSDDLSAQAAALAAEKPLVLQTDWLKKLEAFFAGRGLPMPESNKKQAMLPEGSEMIDNPIGTACGFKLRLNECDLYFTPGVPSEFKLMVETLVLPDIQKQHPDNAGQECSRLYTFGTSESALSDKLDKVELPKGYMLGYRSYLPFIQVKLFGPANDLERRIKVLNVIFKLIEQHVVSVDEPMIEHLGLLLTERQASVAVAEQSTKGWLSNWLHSNENASKLCAHGWILGDHIDVGESDNDPLAAIFALAGATKDKCSTNLAIATGKVTDGQFSIGLAAPEGEWGQTLTFKRRYNDAEQKEVISTVAGDMLRRYLSGKAMFVPYSSLTRDKEMFVPRQVLES